MSRTLWLALLLALGAAPALARGPKLALSAEIETTYSTNLFHVQTRRLGKVDTDTAPGERYHGMQGPGDVFADVGVDARFTRKGKRRFELAWGASYVAHANNRIADYPEVRWGLRLDPSKRSSLAIDAELRPKRFRKNYPTEEAGARVFRRADYRDAEIAASYRRRAGTWRTEAKYTLELARFLSPFANRNETGHQISGILSRKLSRAVELSAGLAGRLTQAPSGTEFGVVVDRSSRDLSALVVAGFDLSRSWDLELGAEVRVRSYTTDQPADDAHFDRTDQKLQVELAVKKRLTRSWALGLETRWTQNRSDRVEPTLDPDEAGYTEAVVAFTVQGRL